MTVSQEAGYYFAVHREQGTGRYILEVRPAVGTWSPFVAAVPVSEKDAVKPEIWPGAVGCPQNWGGLLSPRDGTEGEWAFWSAHNPATPNMSYFIYCTKLPSKLLFGSLGTGARQYTIESPGKPNQTPRP